MLVSLALLALLVEFRTLRTQTLVTRTSVTVFVFDVVPSVAIGIVVVNVLFA